MFKLLLLLDPLHQFDLAELCQRTQPAANARDVIGWWEARRIPFNLVVGSTGLIVCAVSGVLILALFFLGVIDFPEMFGPIFAIPLYALMANLCYTGGWISELFVRRFWPRESDRFAVASFRLGVQFSIALTLLPGVMIVSLGIFGAIGKLAGIVPADSQE